MQNTNELLKRIMKLALEANKNPDSIEGMGTMAFLDGVTTALNGHDFIEQKITELEANLVANKALNLSPLGVEHVA